MPKDIKFIGTTSFIVSDTRVRNVQFLKEKVDIVQLLYLEEASEELEVSDLLRVKGDTEYFIHMPINLNLKTLSGWQTLNIFADKLDILHPLNYIIHAEKAFTSYNLLFPIITVSITENSSYMKWSCFSTDILTLFGIDSSPDV